MFSDEGELVSPKIQIVILIETFYKSIIFSHNYDFLKMISSNRVAILHGSSKNASVREKFSTNVVILSPHYEILYCLL